MTRHRITSRLPLAVLALLLGIGVLAQVRAQARSPVVTSDRDAQALLLSELVKANGHLRSEIKALESELAAYDADGRGAGMQGLVSELNRTKVLNGLIEVSGPGIELLVDGPLSALDLQDLINELRNAGAEAVSLNGHRLVVSSVITVKAKDALVVDGQPVTRPYVFQAIGDAQTLESALVRPGGLVYIQRRSHSDLVVAITNRPHLVLGIHRSPSASGAASVFEYAQPLD